ncbi:DUF4333 domain-containing protein [Nocardia arthritidis]|nr:DUF4333 domain-containing protein [Nocardia arthritidis]
MRRTAATALMILTVAGAAGCGASSDSSVSKSDVQSQVSDKLAAQVGEKPKSVTCPGDLAAKVGTVMRCDLVDNQGYGYGVTVTVTSVEGKDVKFDIKVDDHAKPGTGPAGGAAVSKPDLESEVRAQLAAEVGQAPKAVSCPGDLPAQVGTQMRCQLQDEAGRVYGLTVTVTAVQGTDVKFDIKVDDQPSS